MQPRDAASGIERRRGYRIVAATIGVFLLGIAGYLALTRSVSGAAGWAALMLIAGVGLDAVTAAILARPSLLARIGPLP
ncbi:MAG: hypothetical protein U5L03_12055 [Burkholderiaceae bacterium]|nr:hypothetical protein [Burkholderiaceae bacterium]